MLRRGFVPVLHRSGAYRRAAPDIDINALPSQIGHWPAFGSGTAGTFNPTNTNPGTLTSGPTWNSGAGSSPSMFGGGSAGSINVTTAVRYVAHTAFTPPVASFGGHGRAGMGTGWLICGWIKMDSLPASGSRRPIWIATTGGNGFYVKGTAAGSTLEYYPNAAASAADIATGSWYFVAFRTIGAGATAVSELWVRQDGGTLTKVHNYGAQTSHALNTIMGYSGLGLGGSGCEFRYYAWPTLDTDLVALSQGLEASFPPTYRWQMHDGSGTTALESAPVYVDGSAVSPLPDTLAVHPLVQATAANRPIYHVASVRPVEDLPLLGGMDGVLRFDQTNDQLGKTGVLGAAVTQLTVMLCGRFWDPDRSSTDDKRFSCWGASKAGLGTAATDRWLTLGGLGGRANVSGVTHRPWLFEAACFDGATTRFARSTYPMHAWPLTLGLQYDGAAGTLKLYYNGVLDTTATGLPASLDLSGLFALCPNACGWQHYDMVAGTAIWGADTIAAVHRYWARRVAITPIKKRVAYNGGGFDGTVATGYNLNSGSFISDTGRWHSAWTTGTTDPSVTRVRYQSSDTAGDTWNSFIDIQVPVAGERSHLQGNTLLQLQYGANAGRLVIFTLRSPYPALTPWTPTRIYSDDDGDTWSAPVDTTWTDAEISYAIINGRVVQLPSGELRACAQGLRTSESGTQYTSWFMKSTNEGLTWTKVAHITTAAGGTGTTYTVEPTWLYLNGTTTDILCVLRAASGALYQTRSFDSGVTWSPLVRIGTFGVAISDVLPELIRLPDNRIALFKGIRYTGVAANDPALRVGVNVLTSSNEGASWSRTGPVPLGLASVGRNYQGGFIHNNMDLVLLHSNDEVNIESTQIPAALIP